MQQPSKNTYPQTLTWYVHILISCLKQNIFLFLNGKKKSKSFLKIYLFLNGRPFTPILMARQLSFFFFFLATLKNAIFYYKHFWLFKIYWNIFWPTYMFCRGVGKIIGWFELRGSSYMYNLLRVKSLRLLVVEDEHTNIWQNTPRRRHKCNPVL